MITLYSIGGLGNQMFQAAYAKALSLKRQEDVYVDIRSYDTYKIRNFSLENLYIADEFQVINSNSSKYKKRSFVIASLKVYRLYQKLIKKNFPQKSSTILGKTFLFLSNNGMLYSFDRQYQEIKTNNTKSIFLYGYFQSEQYFFEYKQEIMELMKVKTKPNEEELKMLNKIKNCNAIAISMRLGDDYKKSDVYNVCNEDYYIRGMNYLYDKNPDATFFIFSDCIDKAKKMKFPFPVIYIEKFNEYESLRLMYNCNHFVISNSSFSWWGAYLSIKEDKIVVAPDKWFNDEKDDTSIYTEEMVLISTSD